MVHTIGSLHDIPPFLSSIIYQNILKSKDSLGDERIACLSSSALILAGTGGMQPPRSDFSQTDHVKSGISRRNFQYPRVNQFYTYPENLMTLNQMAFDL